MQREGEEEKEVGEGGKEGERAAQRDTKQQTHRKRKKSKTRTPEDLRHQNKKPETGVEGHVEAITTEMLEKHIQN